MLDKLTGRALLEAIGALAENPHPQDKRTLQRRTPTPRQWTGYRLPRSMYASSTPCRHCKPNLPCLKHAKY